MFKRKPVFRARSSPRIRHTEERGWCERAWLVCKPTPNPPRARRGSVPNKSTWLPHGFPPVAQCKVAPRICGVHGKMDVIGVGRRYRYANHTIPQRKKAPFECTIYTLHTKLPAPRVRGVPPCIKPTVKTVGATTPAYPPRNAALSRRSKGAERHAETDEWRCGLTPKPANQPHLFAPIETPGGRVAPVGLGEALAETENPCALFS